MDLKGVFPCYLLCLFWAVTHAQHCLYPFHKHVRLPGPDRKTFRECVPPGNFELKDCPGDSEYDIQLQACKFVDGSTEIQDKTPIGSGNGLQERIGKSLPFAAAIGGNVLHAIPQIHNSAQSIVQFGPPIANPQQGQWLPVTAASIEQPIELIQDCTLGSWCPHDPKKLQYCDLNGQQFLQCSASGWVMKSCPFGTVFVGSIGRCVDPRETGMGGSVLPPPPTTTTNSIVYSGGLQLGPAAQPPSAPGPGAGTWIGNSVQVGQNGQGNAQNVVQASPPLAQTLLHNPVLSTFPVFQQPQPRPFPLPLQPPPPQLINTAPDTLIQKTQAQELPQGQLVIINGNGQGGPFSPELPIGSAGQPVPVQPSLLAPPGTSHGFATHPRTKVFPSWPSPDVDPPPRWSQNPVVDSVLAPAPPSSHESASASGSAGSGSSTKLQPQQWILGGNVHQLSPSTDIRELPMGTWVPAASLQPPQPQQTVNWSHQAPAQLPSSQAIDSVISRRYSAIVPDSDHPGDTHDDDHEKKKA